ncbi:MAG TPA: hypothetical protein PLJ62_06975 [Thermoflexales bacterium]|nr:hypothetical protein [Thermoflexales bacterium]HQW34914.1 hypothetical protein [Thermoflexales bacterium]HQZ99920.1 hypothetical protein [Thermoflexales bacterium]
MIEQKHFTQALLDLLDETMDNVRGYYLDKGTSLFETLATISAKEASIPVGSKCATLAAQVKHAAFYFYVIEMSVRNPNFPRADWGEIWRTVGAVNAAEWDAIRAELRASYVRIRALIQESPAWGEDEIGGALGVLAHTAYHLGEIRQALCILKP